MLERLTDLPADVYGLRAGGKVTQQDYNDVLRPLLSDARSRGGRVRFLYHFTPDFEGFTPVGALEDMRLGLQHLRLLERCAIVTDIGWLRNSSRLLGMMMPCPVGIFGNSSWDEALAWVSAPPQARHLTHDLRAESGVLLLELKGPLSAEDFDAVALAVDPWIEAHEELSGLVLHVQAFRGWEDVGSLLRHIAFVRDHHRKVRRVAVAADGKFAGIAP